MEEEEEEETTPSVAPLLRLRLLYRPLSLGAARRLWLPAAPPLLRFLFLNLNHHRRRGNRR